MTQIVVLPNENLCPEGAVIEAGPGESVCRALLRNDIDIEHACEMSCACTTCHVVVREGYDSMEEPDELEDDYLDAPELGTLSKVFNQDTLNLPYVQKGVKQLREVIFANYGETKIRHFHQLLEQWLAKTP